MTINHASKTCPSCREVLNIDARACACGWREMPHGKSDKIQRTCPWNDHGITCALIGSLADSYLGPWYCATHYWQLKGWPVKQNSAPAKSYRERWYAERGLPYEPPKTVNSPPLRHVGDYSGELLQRLQSGKLGPPRTRQPGDDETYIHA